ncbi:MAG: hypothetical protein HPY74_00340 [Firmicutes bacterium]|nr:hypothetical protein [Bacillota bacterium]
MIYFTFFAFSILRGLNAIAVKMAQKGHIKNLHDSIYFTILFSFFQLVFIFLIPPWYKYTFRPDMFLYPACFAIFYLISYILLISSLKEGPTSLTNVVYSFQSIVPIIVSLILWKESMGVFQVIGLVLFTIVLILFNKGSYNEGAESRKISLKWVLLAGSSTLAVGIAVIFTKQYMLTYDGFIKEYLIIYNLIVAILGLPYLTALVLMKKQNFPFNSKFLLYTASPALITDITNMIYMFYITKFKSALFFPLMSILNIISVVIFSRIILKESVSRTAYAGIILSFAAIYLLGTK